jgi:hypothetical protein
MRFIPGLWKEVVLFPDMPAGEVTWVCAAPMATLPAGGKQPGGDVLASWAEGLASRREGVRGRGCLRFAFYGRVSTEDWQDPVMSRARQLQQAVILTAGRADAVCAVSTVPFRLSASTIHRWWPGKRDGGFAGIVTWCFVLAGLGGLVHLVGAG